VECGVGTVDVVMIPSHHFTLTANECIQNELRVLPDPGEGQRETDTERGRDRKSERPEEVSDEGKDQAI
jgi:hypothetical protein